MFAHAVELPDFTQYCLGRGVMDVTQLAQFNMYEKGYPFLIVVKVPAMFEKYGDQQNGNSEYVELCKNFVHVLEYDFQQLDGLSNITADTSEITNGNTKVDVITKVNWEAASKFTMKYQERKGSLFARALELYLRGIKDPMTQVKRWNDMLSPDSKNSLDNGYQDEVFEFLYFVTDNTQRFIEKAFLLTACQFTEVQLDQYNQTKGQIEWQDVNLTFNGYAITNDLVTQKAQEFLTWLNTENRLITQQMRFAYQSLKDLNDNYPDNDTSKNLGTRDFIGNANHTGNFISDSGTIDTSSDSGGSTT